MMEVRTLNKELMETHLEELVILDRSYSNIEEEIWGEEEFLKDLEEKWMYSTLALEEGTPIGYSIASTKRDTEGRYAYIHKNLVAEEHRDRPVLLRLTLHGLRKAKEEGIKRARWKCGKHNTRVYEFHKRFSHKILFDEEVEGKTYTYFERLL